MKKLLSFVVVFALAAAAAFAQSATMPADHGIFAPDAIQWQDGPKSLPAGAKFAVLEGDPTKEGLFTMRLSVPAGYKIPPHWHPAVEHVTVISGSFNIGMGDTFDQTKGSKMTAGTFGFLAPKMHHFAWTDEAAVIQLHGTGPWQINYINASDDPRKK